MSPAGSAITALLGDLGVNGEVRKFAEPTRTAAEAAEALGCEIWAIANSLIFVADDEAILILASGAHRVDTEVIAEHTGAIKVARATPQQVREATGQDVGAVAPVGHRHPLRSFIDTALRRHPAIWASAGTTHSVFSTTFEELARIAAAEEIVVAR